MAEIVEQGVIEARREILDDANTRSQLEKALERAKERERWKRRGHLPGAR